MKSLENYISICIWGEWLGGRIGENAYQLVNEEKKPDSIILYFNGNEKCTIIKPIGMTWNGKRLNVKSAEKIVWEFYYYGKPQTPETLIKMEYSLMDSSQVHVVETGCIRNRDEVIKIKNKMAIDSF